GAAIAARVRRAAMFIRDPGLQRSSRSKTPENQASRARRRTESDHRSRGRPRIEPRRPSAAGEAARGASSSRADEGGCTRPALWTSVRPAMDSPLEDPRPSEPVAPAPLPRSRAPRPVDIDAGDLPWGYGENRITAIVRDPDSAYLYWEITDEGIAAARSRLGPGGDRGWCNLRIY